MNAAASMCPSKSSRRLFREHDQERPQPLAAAGDDVRRDLVDEGHAALQASSDHRVNASSRLDQGTDFIEGHGWKCIWSGAIWPGRFDPYCPVSRMRGLSQARLPSSRTYHVRGHPTGGKQYRVTQDGSYASRSSMQSPAQRSSWRVLLVGEGADVKLGVPHLKGER